MRLFIPVKELTIMTTQTMVLRSLTVFLSKLGRLTKGNRNSHHNREHGTPRVEVMMMKMKAYYSSHCVLHSKMVAMSA